MTTKKTLEVILNLGENIRARRETLGLSQVDLAKSIGTSHPRISEIECGSGNPTVKTVEKLAKALGTTPSKLLSEKKLQKVC